MSLTRLSILAIFSMVACTPDPEPDDTGETDDTSDAESDSDDSADSSDTSADTSDTSEPVDGVTQPVVCTTYGGQAAEFNGASNVYTNFLYIFGRSPRAYTFELWAKPSALPSGEIRMLDASLGNTTEQDPNLQRSYFVLDLANGAPQYEAHAASAVPESATVGFGAQADDPIALNEWSHIAIVLDPGVPAVKFYINGVFAGERAGVDPWWNTPMEAARHLQLGGRGAMFFNGQLDDFRVWNVARTQAQIRANLCTSFTAATAPAELAEQITFDDGFTTMTDVAMTTEGTVNRVARP